MNIILWIAIGLLVVGLVGLALSGLAKTESSGEATAFLGIVSLILALGFGIWGALPQYRLYRATIEKRILVEDALAQRDAAVNLAEAEVNRAKGVAEANIIVAQSITEQYLRYLFIDQLDEIDGQVIYVPTEAGIPILEANRLAPDVESGE